MPSAQSKVPFASQSTAGVKWSFGSQQEISQDQLIDN